MLLQHMRPLLATALRPRLNQLILTDDAKAEYVCRGRQLAGNLRARSQPATHNLK